MKVALALVAIGALARADEPAPCTAEYAENLTSLAAKARDLDASSRYSYCVRTTAVYECVSYGGDGNLRRARRTATAHGTAFGYHQDDDGSTLLLTNYHVAEWPAVTDDEHPVEGVPLGCKKVSDALKIVDDDRDDYAPDDVPLTRVVTDPQLDVAVLRARTKLAVIPWKVGRSAALHERNIVEVKGFPLGAFAATNVGKVISAYDHDDYKDWDHDDFVIDALLSQGNSGSPVLAVSCKTGEFELVGIFHAAYAQGSALNVVIGIDQVRDLMTTLKRTPHPRDAQVSLDSNARARLATAILGDATPFFPVGGLTATASVRGDGAILWTLFGRDFPSRTAPLALLEDLRPAADGFGDLGRVWIAGDGPGGLRAVKREELDADAQAQVAHLLDTLRRGALTAWDWRAATRDASSSRDAFVKAGRLERTATRAAERAREVSQGAPDLADRLAAHAGDPTTVAEVLKPITATAPTAGVRPSP